MPGVPQEDDVHRLAHHVLDTSVIHVVGARPNIVKAAPVVWEMRSRGVRQAVIFTGQHRQRDMSQQFLDDFYMTPNTVWIPHGLVTAEDRGGRLGQMVSTISHGLVAARRRDRCDAVIVYGDVDSTLAGALAAKSSGIPLVHVESGLRSHDERMPEEMNRRLVDHASDLLIVHSSSAIHNLSHEGIPSARVRLDGNTLIDALWRFTPQIISRQARIVPEMGLERRGYVLVTMHRPAVVDGPQMEAVMDSLGKLARRINVVFPVHPRTRSSRHFRLNPKPGLRVIDPLRYVDFMALMSGAAGVITDSGGVQEETSALGIPCATFRRSTERPITVSNGTNTVIGEDPDALLPENVLGLFDRIEDADRKARLELWDGNASRRVVDSVLRFTECLRGDAPSSV